jgi:hypothetical protein
LRLVPLELLLALTQRNRMQASLLLGHLSSGLRVQLRQGLAQ